MSTAKLSNGTSHNVFDDLKKSNATSDAVRLKECFETFDKDRDQHLNREEFSYLLSCLFSNGNKPYTITSKQEDEIFKLLDENQDGLIDIDEFKVCWYHWMKQILDPVSAIIIVDVQNDFIIGTLAIKNAPAKQDGAAVIPVINKMIEECPFDTYVYSGDWHPEDHISFIQNVNKRPIHTTSKVTAENAQIYDTVVFSGPPLVEQKLWPAHCIQNTWGAELHKELKLAKNRIKIHKGTQSDLDSYSAFWDNAKKSQTGILAELTKQGVTDIYVCGIAYDVCVGSTALHAIEHGFRTVLVDDASRGVDMDEIIAMKQKLLNKGVVIVDSPQVKGMVDATDRRPELGYQALLNVALAKKLLKNESKENQK